MLVPVAAGLTGLVVAWDFVLGTYEHRHFTPAERLLTEARVLWLYLGLLALPRIQAFALHHDYVPVSTGLLEPWTTLPALGVWAVLLALALLVGVGLVLLR